MKNARPENAALYRAAEQFKDRCLRSDGSLFSPGMKIWSAAPLEQLQAAFVGETDESDRTFIDKLGDQLRGKPDDVIELAAEMLYICVHGLVKVITPGKKRSIVNEVLGWMRSPSVIPADLDEAFERGYCNPGVGVNTHRYWNVKFILDFALEWRRRSAQERAAMLADPWLFKAFLWDLEIHAAQTIRNLLLHVVHPDTFEHISSDDHKRQIAEAFAEHSGDAEDDLDRRLLAIREALSGTVGTGFNFYEDPVRGQWRPEDTESGSVSGEASVWKIAPGRGAIFWDAWRQGGYASIGSDELGDMRLVSDRDWPTHLEETCARHNRKISGPKQVRRFYRELKRGDLLVANKGHSELVGLGIVDGDYWFDAEAEQHAHRVPVRWLDFEPRPVAQPGWNRTLIPIKDALAEEMRAEAERLAGGSPAATRTETSGGPWDRAADELLMPPEVLSEWRRMLEHRQQLIFYGPPGTGKTFIARKLAAAFTGSSSRVDLVQFHPSYAYEDFVEGYRPRKDKEGFQLVSGPLKRLATKARNAPDEKFVLIIDEINRGNLARVFGELFFLLEYRDELVTLQYTDDSEGRFAMPKNLYIIGTMNTADRSVALFDAALRRRFFFVALYPDRAPIEGLLERFVARHGLGYGWLAGVLKRANAKLAQTVGPDLMIGPSHFLDPKLDDERLQWAWEHTVLPYLEDNVADGSDVRAEFALEALKSSGRAPASEGPVDEGSGAENPVGSVLEQEPSDDAHQDP